MSRGVRARPEARVHAASRAALWRPILVVAVDGGAGSSGGTAEIIIEAAPPTEADEDAGIAGLPFMQTDHEDEHEEWIDWAAVEQQAGGGGGSSS